MKVVVVNGSPRGQQSNTQVMLTALANGFTAAGAEIHSVCLAEKTIGYCRGCYSCWVQTPGTCIQADDMAGIILTMQCVDVLIFGSPLYFQHISGTLKVFFDRLTAAGGDPHKRRNPADAVKPHIVMVGNCGHPHRGQFALVSQWIHIVAHLMQATLIGEFYTTHGKILTQPTPEQHSARTSYLSFLESCGERLGRELTLSPLQAEMATRNILDFA